MIDLLFESASAPELRAFALEAYRRAEALERTVALERQRAENERQRADEFEFKAKALDEQVGVLLRRISELTKQLAEAKDVDAQLALDLELHVLRERLANLSQEKFGSTSERRGRPEDPTQSNDEKAARKKAKKGHGPTKQPALPLVEVVHLLDAADCVCPKCAANLKVMAEQYEETELVSVVQVRYELHKHKQQKYRCGRCGHIEAALGPQRLIPGGRYDLAFTVQVAIDKFLDHLPLERQVERMQRRGLLVTGQALWDQLWALYVVLLPTYLALQARVLSSDLLHADETPWRVMGKGGERRSAKWWLWTLVSASGVFMDILPTRGAQAAKMLLRDYSGVVVADGYGVYASLERALERAGGVQVDLVSGEAELLPNFALAGCWMHARRPFFKAEKSAPEVGVALDLIARLYAVEARAREAAGDDPDALLQHRRRLREAESRPIVEELKLWRDAQRPLPGTQYHAGVTFLRNQWGPLTRFLADERVPLDNGEAERQIRGPVVGRKNFYGSQTERGTRVAALLYSLLLSAKQAGVDPHTYLLAATETALRDRGAVLLPQDFAAATLALG